MPEPTHALRHHLRCAADRAIESEVADAEERPDGYSSPEHMIATVWTGLTGFVRPRNVPDDYRKEIAGTAERCAGLLLRAAVWLRRSG